MRRRREGCDEFTGEREERKKKKEEEERKERKKRRKNIESYLCTPTILNYNKELLLLRGCTPITLTVEEPRKFCALLIYSTAHNVDFTTRYQHEKLSCRWKAQRHKSGEALPTSHLYRLESHR